MTRQVDNKKLDAMIQYRRGALHFDQNDFSEAVEAAIDQIDKALTYINEASTLARELDLDSVVSMIEEVSGLDGFFKRVRVNYLRFGLKKETAELEEWLKKTSG